MSSTPLDELELINADPGTVADSIREWLSELDTYSICPGDAQILIGIKSSLRAMVVRQGIVDRQIAAITAAELRRDTK